MKMGDDRSIVFNPQNDDITSTFTPALSSPDEKVETEKSSKIFVDRSPLNQSEFHEMFEFVPKRNHLIPFVANHLHHYQPVSREFVF